MTPVHQDDWLTVYGGDNREVMRSLPDESVQCVVTSPPYWGLRDYGTASWDGGDPQCDHRQAATHVGPKSTLRSDGRAHVGPYDGEKAVTEGLPFKDRCGKCGAVRQDRQLGLEQTPEEYVAAMVDVFREVRRVLRKDGTLWLNLGDSYASGGDNRNGKGGSGLNSNPAADVPMKDVSRTRPDGLKPKDLVGIPWRVAFALQADGWYLRSDIIWSKPNPMPESVTDRPTKAHEYLFLLSKSERYHYDADAIREGLSETPEAARRRAWHEAAQHDRRRLDRGEPNGDGQYGRGSHYNPAGRNRRSVWTIATKPYAGSHFAVFPEALVEPCILAGTSAAGACATCGAPWERVVERETTGRGDTASALSDGIHERSSSKSLAEKRQAYRAMGMEGPPPARDLGFRPTCPHPGDPVPCVVLDPFAGTGTVGVVAQRLSRRALLIDLNPDYLRQCLARNAAMPLGLVG